MPTLPHTHSPQPFTFQQTLDVYDFCTDRLQERLKANRQANDLKNNPLKPSSATENSGSAAAIDSATDSAQPMEVEETAIISGSGPVDTGIDSETMDAMLADVEDEEEREALRAALLMSVNDPPPPTTSTTGTTRAPPTAGTAAAATRGVPVGGGGLPEDFLGLYELHSMVTHKGRSADSGHYIGWVRDLLMCVILCILLCTYDNVLLTHHLLYYFMYYLCSYTIQYTRYNSYITLYYTKLYTYTSYTTIHTYIYLYTTGASKARQSLLVEVR